VRKVRGSGFEYEYRCAEYEYEYVKPLLVLGSIWVLFGLCGLGKVYGAE